MDVEIINIGREEKVVINKRELEIGTRIEKREHGFNSRISRKIARDHIEENPKYYTHRKYGLIVIEKKLGKFK